MRTIVRLINDDRVSDLLGEPRATSREPEAIGRHDMPFSAYQPDPTVTATNHRDCPLKSIASALSA